MSYKQVIVVRRDLKLSKGKLAAQVAHASLQAYKKTNDKLRNEWEQEGAKKVILRVENEKELMYICEKAKKEKLACSLIQDAGKTHLARGTTTCAGIGPDKEDRIDKVTKHLKLFG